jgi:hypothetical protein
MKRYYLPRILLLTTLFSGFACLTLTKTITEQRPQPTSAPDEDATAAAIATDIGVPPSMVAWMSTVNAYGTQVELPPTNSLVFNGNWIGKGSTSDLAYISITMIVENNQIVDATLDYTGSEGGSCQLRASTTDANFKAKFLPAKIDAHGSVSLGNWGVNVSFYEENKSNGSIKTNITNQAKLECNIGIKGMWSANKQ